MVLLQNMIKQWWSHNWWGFSFMDCTTIICKENNEGNQKTVQGVIQSALTEQNLR